MPCRHPLPAESEIANPASRILLLFDVDGTLSPSQRPIVEEFRSIFRDLYLTKSRFDVGVVSGSDEGKVIRQFGLNDRASLLQGSAKDDSPLLKYCFFENGVMAYSSVDGKEAILREASMADQLGKENLQKVVNYVDGLFATLKLPWSAPCKIEQRHATLNVSPIGRACSLAERKAFAAYDQETGLRERLAVSIRENVADKLNLEVCAGGQISLDIFPEGWDKSICLNVIDLSQYEQVHFFGDRCLPGGNDYALYIDPRVTHPHVVSGPEDTLQQLQQVLVCTFEK